MSISLKLQGTHISDDGKQIRLWRQGSDAYKYGMKINQNEIQKWDQGNPIGPFKLYTTRVDAVLNDVEGGCPKDINECAIDLRTQIKELGLLVDSTQNIKTVVSSYASDAERAKWSNDNVLQDRIWSIAVLEAPSLSVTGQYKSLNALIFRIKIAQAKVQSKIDAENILAITPTLDFFLLSPLIRIIAQYMD